ncbi:hypothetical protein [Bacillus sp. FJAT-45037]|uniref:hypothetical protein n=1 Tax=Bacillus sp. FJAT-45037 TaxID=2011007 RepID=UPI000C23A8E0|nr:hypothetical protein [Bacillus sp. FJAT-45037]
MKLVGWFGLFHVFFIVMWMVINIIFSIQNPLELNEGEQPSVIAIEYWSQFPGYLGMDHGSKALLFLLSIMIPIGLYAFIKKVDKQDALQNLVAMICGVLGFVIYSISFMLQATAVEYAINTYSATTDESRQQSATMIMEWTMLEGGFSTSLYILSNFLLAVWLILHAKGLTHLGMSRRFVLFSYVVGALNIIGYSMSWFYLMRGQQVMHDVTEAVGLLFLVWLVWVSVSLIRNGMRRKLNLRTAV